MIHEHHHHAHLGKKLWIAIFLTSFITLAQIITGFMSGSLSLLTDALHNFSDVIALLLSYYAYRLSYRKSTLRLTFGYKRSEILAALLNIVSLASIAALLCREAIGRFFNPVEVEALPIISMGTLSIVINTICVLLIHHEAKSSLNIRSTYLHLFTDILSSVAVVLGGVLIFWTQLSWIDSILTIAIACYLAYSSWHVFMDIVRIIMHFTPDHIKLEELEKELLSHSKVANVHHVHVWQLNDRDVHFEAHVDFEVDLPLSEVSQVISQLSQQLRDKFGIRHTVIQPEIGVDDSKQLIVTECHT